MQKLAAAIIIPALVGLLGAYEVAAWLSVQPKQDLSLRIPGMDAAGNTSSEGTATDSPASPDARGGGAIGGNAVVSPVKPGEPQRFEGNPSHLAGSWPWFRGPNHDAISVEPIGLARQWPSGGPKVLWTVKLLGPGHAGAAVAGGCVYVLDHDPNAQADTLRCFSLDDGREIWRNGYPVSVVENHGMSRTVPAVFEDSVITLGPKCHLASWDAKTGKNRWLVDLVLKYHARVPTWYTGQCPLVDEGRLIVAPCADACLVAVDCHSGRVLWESSKVRDWDMTHVSIAPMEFHGQRMYVYCGSRGVVGISARDGAVLWESTAWIGKMATCPTPVPVNGERMFLSSGYNAGSLMLQLDEVSGRIAANSLWRLKPKQFESEQHTPIYYGGHLFGVRDTAGGEQLVCLDLNGKECWNSGGLKVGRGPYMIADGVLYVLSQTGLLTMAEATAESFRPLGQSQVFDQAVERMGPNGDRLRQAHRP